MPTYQDPHRGVSISEQALEAAMTAPAGRAMLTTFELWHPSFSLPMYVVDDYQPVTAAKEATAVRDAGLYVTFLAVSVTVGKPEQSDQAANPSVTLTVSNVSGLISQALRAARGSLDPWVLILREYASDDLSAPSMMPPLELYVTGISVTAELATLTCGFGDSANTSVPRLTFRRDQYPGLIA